MNYIDPQGRRVSTETGYLTPDVLSRPNLKVVVHAQVTKILFEKSNEEGTRAVGVEFKDTKGSKFLVRARKEVVLS